MSNLAAVAVPVEEGSDLAIEHSLYHSRVQQTPSAAQEMVSGTAAGEVLVEILGNGSEELSGAYDRSLSQTSSSSSSSTSSRSSGGSSVFSGGSSIDGTFSRSSSLDFKGLQPSRSGKLTSASEQDLRKIFQSVDLDHDGRVCVKELTAYLAKLPFKLTDKDVEVLLASADDNGDRCLEFHEFQRLYKSVTATEKSNAPGLEDVMEVDEAEDDQALRDAFTVFDRNNDGLISPSELLLVMRSMSSSGNSKKLSDCSRMIKAVDKDGDGQVNFQEFKEMMTTSFL